MPAGDALTRTLTGTRAGALPPGVPLPRSSSTTRIEAAHGTRDPVVPFAAGQATARMFEAAGYPVCFTSITLTGHALSGIGHTIAPALAAALRPPGSTPARSLGLHFGSRMPLATSRPSGTSIGRDAVERP